MNTDALKITVIEEMAATSESKIAELETELANEKRFLALLRQRKNSIPSANHVSPQSTNGNHSAASTAPAPVEQADRMEEGKVPQFIVAAMEDAKRPMRVHELVAVVKSRGATSKAKKGLLAVVSSALARRKDLFVRTGRGLYDLVGRRSPENTNGG